MTLIATLKFLHALTGFWFTAGLVGRGVAQLRAERTTEIYWATGRRPGGAIGPIDLAKPEEELLDLIRS